MGMNLYQIHDLAPIPSAVSIGRIPRDRLMTEAAVAVQDSDRANSFMRLFTLFQSAGMSELALEMHERALEQRRVYRLQGAAHPTIRLLALMGPRPEIDNSPLEYLVDETDIELTLYYPDYSQPMSGPIPDHDIAMISLGESQFGAPRLSYLDDFVQHWPRPIINRPSNILNCARDRLTSLFSDCDGLLVPNTRRISRDDLAVLSFPFLIRPLDSHGGKGFEKMDSVSMLRDYGALNTENEFYVSDFIDYRSGDGLYRKYRIVLMDKLPYLCHMAITDHWMVHYMAAGMELSAEKRAEEETAFATFAEDFAQRHKAALSTIADRLNLDYVVIDCGEMPDGRLVLFEADNRAWVHSVDPPEIFPYKAGAMKKVFEAFRALVVSRHLAGR